MYSNPKIQAIVAALGGELLQTEYTWRWDFTYQGFTLYIKEEKDKYEIHVCCHKHNSSAFNSKAENAWKAATTQIGVSQSKSAEKIASDIKKRFDFDLLKQIEGMFADADAEYSKMCADHDKFVNDIIEKIGGKKHKTHDLRSVITFYPLSFEITVQNTSVKIEIDSALSVEQIATIYKAVRNA